MKRNNLMKLTGFVLLIAMLCSFVGCGSNTANTSSTQSQTQSQVQTQSVPEVVTKTQGSEKWDEKINYTDSSNWLSIPEKADKDVDVIYYYPTTFSKAEDSVSNIADINDATMRSGAERMLKSQASAFEQSCNIYAPFYRQVDVTYALTLTDDENEELMRYSASKDPTDALDYYFKNYNNGKPFIIAGHSQGSEVSTFLLADYMKEHPEYASRMVAAYIIGYSVTDKYLAQNTHLKFAEKADDTGVIVSWNTEGEENKDAHNAVVLKGAISINPINWKRDNTYASKEENLGSFLNGEIVKNVADAQVNTERGVVVTTADKSYAMPESPIFGSASYHVQDYGLYYKNIEENVAKRIEAFKASNK